MYSFGEILKKLRQGKKMSQTEMAKVLGKTQSSIAYYEKNEKKPGPEIINKIADYFSVTTDYLLGRSSDPVQYSSQEAQFIKDAGNSYTVDDLKKKYKLIADDGEPITDEELEEAVRYVLIRRRMKNDE
jgi:transcriptional regulator with XRE-family HTH domain